MECKRMPKFFLIVGSLFFLAGCSLPVSPSSATNTPQANLVASQVALLLTPTQQDTAASSALTPVSGLPDTPTSAPGAPTLTPSPTVTASPTPQPTGTATSTTPPTQTPPMAPSPTSTPAPDDPKATLGTPTWSASFLNGKAFGLETAVDDSEFSFEVKNGALVMNGKKPDGYHAWRLALQKTQNFYIEASFAPQDCAGLDRYGLIFRTPDNNKGYFFGVSCDGQYSLRIWDGSTFSADLIRWAKSDAIHAGANQTNVLGVMGKDAKISLYANGHLLGELSDTTYTQGVFGCFIASTNTPNFTVQVNGLNYWKLP